MSAESTLLYYRILIELVQARLGGLHGPDLIIRSVDFATVAQAQADDDWEALGQALNHEARCLVAAGAQILVLATNTMHKVGGAMMEGIDVPFLHIADTTADAILRAGFRQPGLMATAFTMEQDFYLDRLRHAGLTPLVPDRPDRAETHRIIYQELCKGVVNVPSEKTYVAIAQRLADAGADCLILGCTEVGMLMNEQNAPLPVFDTTRLHCEAALDAAMA